MCGICGFYSKEDHFSKNDLEKMSVSLAHRGPDAEGYFTDSVVGLAHRRLSILDLSDKGNQPMHSHNGRFVMSYNGEVYNYREIASELKSNTAWQKPIMFRSASDSEVILEAFSYYGPSFVEKLNGMFAIAIYDKQTGELYIFRDRMGIKPLYYFWDGHNFAFASELKALAALPQIPKKLNRAAIQDFLHLGYIPAPSSIYQLIHKLESGCFLKVRKNALEIRRYWDLCSKFTKEVIKEDKKALVLLSDLLMSSVQYQLKSDVPFGVFLSGGIDSSLVTAQAKELSSVKVNTFSIGFEENQYNESVYAKKIAQYLGTHHHEFIVSHKDALPLVEKMISTYDEPFADSSAIPTMLVSKLARKHVTVTLSGEGGDELFMGYGSYQWARTLHNPLVRLLRHPISSALRSIPANRYKRASALFEYPDPKNIKSHIFSQEQYLFSEAELEEMLAPEYSRNISHIHQKNICSKKKLKRVLSPMEEQAVFDMNYYLQEDLLAKVDRASMQYSLETRVPYLDHRIVEFALNISPDLKLKNGVTKYILKEILFQYIPEKFFDRKKQGFAIPLNLWLLSELRYLVEENLNRETIEQFGIVNYPVVENIKKRFFAGENYLYNRLWLLIILHKFLKTNP